MDMRRVSQQRNAMPLSPIAPSSILCESHAEPISPHSPDTPIQTQQQMKTRSFRGMWEPTPEMISSLIQYSNLFHSSFSSPLTNCQDQSSTSLSSQSDLSQQNGERQSTFSVSSGEPAFISINDIGKNASSPTASASSRTQASKNQSTFVKLVQPIPLQSRTFFKSVPLHAQQANRNSYQCSSSKHSGLYRNVDVDPFDSECDMLSLTYILTTSAYTVRTEDTCAQAITMLKQPIRYLLKVFPDQLPFNHAATRPDPKNKSSFEEDRMFMKTVVQDAIEHELGAMAWAQQYLTLTHTPRVLGYAYQRDFTAVSSKKKNGHLEANPDPSSDLEMYGILGFILMEFPADGVIYRGPSEECRTQDYRQIEISEHLAKILHEMRSTCSVRVSGFSIHTTTSADDGTTVYTDSKVTQPYTRFDLIVNALHRKDIEKITKPELSQLSEAATTISQTTSSKTVSAAETIKYTPSIDPPHLLLPKKNMKHSSLSRMMHIKQIERQLSDSLTQQDLAQSQVQPSLFTSSTTETIDAVDILERKQTNAAPIQQIGTLVNNFQNPRRQYHELQDQLSPQNDILASIATKLVNSPPPARDALEACKRLSQVGHTDPRKTDMPQIVKLAIGTVRRLDVEQTKVSLNPLSTIIGNLKQAPSSSVPLSTASPEILPHYPPSPEACARHPKTIHRVSSCFDNDSSVYCSSHAQASNSDKSGKISHLIMESDPSSPLFSTETFSWPKEFIMVSRDENDQPIHNSVAEYEFSRFVNALVALERLDSAPGSMTKFPKELLSLLPRIMRLAYQGDILFTGEGSANRGKRPQKVSITNTAFFRRPGLFDGIESVFTHGQLAAQGSLVTTDRKQKRSAAIVAMANFQRAGFLPPYNENIREVFIEKVYSSFWNMLPEENSMSDEDEENEIVSSVKKRSDKRSSRLWPFKWLSNIPVASSAPRVSANNSVDSDDQGREGNDSVPTYILPQGAITVHGKHPVPYPLLNHAIENGSSCGNRYMVLVDSSVVSPIFSSSESLTSTSIDSQVSDLDIENLERRFSNSSATLTHQSATRSTGTQSTEKVKEAEAKKKGLARMKNKLRAPFKAISKMNKNKLHTRRNDFDKSFKNMSAGELISGSSITNDLLPMSSSGLATKATFPYSELAFETGKPPQIPLLPFMTEAPSFDASPSALSPSFFSNLGPFSSTRSTTPQVALIPETQKMCDVAWMRFLNTYCELESYGRKVATAENTIFGGESNYTRGLAGPSVPWSNSSFIALKESAHSHQQNFSSGTSSTVSIINSPTTVLGALVSISKTLQNLVVALEAGGIVLTPEQLLSTISHRQKLWQQKEDERLEQVEAEKLTLRQKRAEAAERQYHEQQKRALGLERQNQHKTSNESQEVPPKVPPKEEYRPEVPSKDVGYIPSKSKTTEDSTKYSRLKTTSLLSECIRTSTRSQFMYPSQISMLSSTVSLSDGVNAFASNNIKQGGYYTTAGTSRETDIRLLNSSYIPSSPYMDRTSDDNILYSTPGLQRDPLPSELPDHIQFPLGDIPLFSSSVSSFANPAAPIFSENVTATSTAAGYERRLPHILGTMVAPTLPAYGIRLTNPEGTRTLAQVEAERIETEMREFWYGLEALCELDIEPRNRVRNQSQLNFPPGIVLLSITELENNLKAVEAYVREMEGRIALTRGYEEF
ncbi:hypothetical protein FBU30_000661 [Linnemannia zychae]|nr:hypothetical protein FBU30_000661 [Linnemannia zychae]